MREQPTRFARTLVYGGGLVFAIVVWLLILVFAFAQPAAAQTVTGTGEITLSWTRPTEYQDGSPLPIAEIAGYRVHFGESQGGPYTNMISIDNGGVSSSMFEIELSEPTTLYFAMTAVATNGQEGAFSNEVMRTFDLEIIDERDPGPPSQITIDVTMTCATDVPGVTCAFTVQ